MNYTHLLHTHIFVQGIAQELAKASSRNCSHCVGMYRCCRLTVIRIVVVAVASAAFTQFDNKYYKLDNNSNNKELKNKKRGREKKRKQETRKVERTKRAKTN